ncbi:unnamed protein product (macronuclear) [Paramecium tetraurelia]|uniref:P-type ATPase A domain-containing protein n=1 Tax=Paramecium tetraurelia TaxID=5888 RepID=A0DUK4_PARTE|nr:uncharacterized protein GSPATT00020393001 [Paramecium tetraurelia]CAK86721.1 unnamed protein product [Paramecium tetraurelia]|eukprot:XP_001454118.1 hypothetical protein (macronuclear) [Paramecium tetraurelia strain d4-2]
MEVQIINSQIEGEHKLKSIQCVRISYERLVMLVTILYIHRYYCAYVLGFWQHFTFGGFLINLLIFCTSRAPQKRPHTLRPIRTMRSAKSQEMERRSISNSGNTTRMKVRFLKYELLEDKFKPLEFEPKNANSLTTKEVQAGQQDYGSALMKIPMIGFLEFTLEELSTPFYTLQYICVVIWLVQGFFYFAIVMMSCSLISTFIKFYLLRQSLKRLQSLAAIHQQVMVIRNDELNKIDVNELVPGDIIKLQTMIVPADCIITGMALLNEATLTGESNPVPKQTGQILFEGTKILEVNTGSTAQVIRTNYSTIRGQYFRNVLYPQKVTHKFYTQAMKFLAGFVIFNVIIAAATLVIYLDYTTELILANIFSTLTWIFPPAMPIFFSLTATIALLRLKNENIIGSNMDKIHISGQVDVTCFDKTGTLTTNELTVIGLWDKQDCNICISCCHHICQSEGQLVGDVLDLEMFKYSQSKILFDKNDIQITSKDQKIYKIIKIFDFNSELMMMSVIVECENKYYLCSKGAPEKLQSKLNSQNQEMLSQLSFYVNQGYRVISLAQKEITREDLNLERMQLEINLNFLGYLIFENQLKHDTADVMKQLIESNLKVKILSGDNPLTTVNTAYNIGIANDVVKLFDVRNSEIVEIDIRRIEEKQQIVQQKQYLIDVKDLQNYIYTLNQQFALTGDFMEFCNQHKVDVHSLYQRTIVFARVKPHQKKEVVFMHQQLKCCVAMVGDGSNDCSAISQADIGVSFSQADASYTAHFSSLDQSIKCIVTILAQGRATAQTLTEIFPLYTLLSFLATCAYTCLALEGQNYSDFQLLFLSFLCYIPIMASMTLTKALPNLSKELPLDDMYQLNNQLSFYTHVFIFTGGLLVSVAIVMNAQDHHFDKPEPPIRDYLRSGMLNSATVIIAQIYSQFLPFIFIISKPFKEYCYKNYVYMTYSTLSFSITILFVFFRPSQQFLDLVDFNSEISL